MTERKGSSVRWGGMVAGMVVGVFAPLALLGQACLGSPNGPGQYSVVADANITSGANDFGVGVEANFPGPLGARAGVALDDFDDDDRRTRFEGRLSYDIRSGPGINICPVGGADFTRRTQDSISENQLRIPLALSVGGRIDAGDGIRVVPSARAGFAHWRFSGDAFDTTRTENSVFAIAGAALALDDVHIRAEVGIDSFDDEPFYRFQVGYRR
ncbi:MAG: hypothetical protein EA422_13520 [Gemmatimonadales bacterium]|nr:MAG: hypothetical protein EA422_13520 [Gemmatimonadales bacterium]